MEINDATIIEIIKSTGTVVARETLSSEKLFSEQGIDSLDVMSIILAIEEAFDIKIPDEDVDSIVSINHAIEYLKTKLK